MDAAPDLPPLYAGWIGALLPSPIPREREATCSSCAMLDVDGGIAFRTDTKCCTFTPVLPNFLVGGVLGEPSIEARIDAGLALSPLGIGVTNDYRLLYEASTGTFGRTRAMRCPHYVEQTGGCGVWRRRNATCATWFCKHVRGATGQRFWSVLRKLLETVEHGLALHCLDRLDVDVAHLPLGEPTTSKLAPGELDRVPDLEQRRAEWGDWFGRERELYRACAELVEALSWSEVLAIVGPPARLHAKRVIAHHAALVSDAMPSVLALGLVQIRRRPGNTCRVTAYRAYDPLDVPAALVEVLHRFDGRDPRIVVDEIAADYGLELDDKLVRALADFEILVSPR